MVRTRSKALQKTVNALQDAAIDSCANGNASDEWDFSGLECVGWKSVKTYSKKQPQQWVSTSRQKRFTPDLSSKPDISQKRKSDNYCPVFPSSNLNSARKTISTGKRKYADMSKRFNKLASCTKRRNKTTISVGSMSPCTILRGTLAKDDMKMTDQSMSLCSISDGNLETCNGLTSKHSTIIAQYDQNVDFHFVPNDISLIEGDEEQRTISSCYNEQTVERQPLLSSVSLKKVEFTIGGNKCMSKIDPTRNPSRQSILKKTPQTQSTVIECPRTSSPDPNKKHALFECDMSSLQDSTVDTDKLLDFEPLPLECSERLIRDITPETCTSAKPLGSGKERRRLSYHPHEDVPVCVLLDLPVYIKKKKVPVLFGKNKFQLTLKHIKTIPTDILL